MNTYNTKNVDKEIMGTTTTIAVGKTTLLLNLIHGEDLREYDLIVNQHEGMSTANIKETRKSLLRYPPLQTQ